MKAFVGVALLVVVSSVAAQYGSPAGYGHGGYDQHEEHYYVEPHYNFAYEVHDSHTGDYKSHKEERKGDHTVGVYSLVEPDGSKRTVEYTVEGKSGFNAQVLREPSKHYDGYKSAGYGNEYNSHKEYSQSAYHQPAYKPQPAYHAQPSYYQPKPAYHAEPSYYQPKPAYHAEPSYYQPKPAYHAEPSYYQPKPSYNKPSYDKPSYGGHATSSVSISTHGAKIAHETYHAAPKHY